MRSLLVHADGRFQYSGEGTAVDTVVNQCTNLTSDQMDEIINMCNQRASILLFRASFLFIYKIGCNQFGPYTGKVSSQVCLRYIRPRAYRPKTIVAFLDTYLTEKHLRKVAGNTFNRQSYVDTFLAHLPARTATTAIRSLNAALAWGIIRNMDTYLKPASQRVYKYHPLVTTSYEGMLIDHEAQLHGH